MGRWENLRQKLTVKSENSTWFVSPVWTERNYCVWSNFPAGQKFVHTVWTQSYKQNNNSKVHQPSHFFAHFFSFNARPPRENA